MRHMGLLAMQYVAERYHRGEFTKTSAQSVRAVLCLFIATVGDKTPSKVNKRAAERWRDSLRVAPGTVRNRISVVRGFFEWCIDHDYCKANPLAGMRPPKDPRRLPRGLSAVDVQRILLECGDERATLIVLLECQEGLRAKEVAGLEVGDINYAERELRVVGKGGHERMVPISDETWEALGHYLATYPAKAGPLVRSFVRPDRGLKPATVVDLVGELMKAAGVDESGHALRHTMATDMLRGGADIVEVRDALGHRSIATTQKYLGVTQASRLREAMGGRRYGEPRGVLRGEQVGTFGPTAAESAGRSRELWEPEVSGAASHGDAEPASGEATAWMAVTGPTMRPSLETNEKPSVGAS